jgi:xanthine/uracil/vitamin C permease (AzgA family)
VVDLPGCLAAWLPGCLPAGVMLAISGLELAMSAKDINGEVWEDAFLLFATATSTIAFSSTATGALVGAVTYFALIVAEKLVSERLRKHKQTRALRRA